MSAIAWSAQGLRWLSRRTQVADSSDEELAVRAASGSEPHFEILVERYSAAIYRVAYRMTGSREEAEDIAQETFVKAFRALPRVRLDMPIKPWLYKIATNTAVSSLRRRKDKYQVNLDEAENVTGSGDTSEAVAVQLDAAAAVAQLPLDYRQVVVLRAIEDLPFAEIGEILEIPEATARTRFNRAKTLLKGELRT